MDQTSYLVFEILISSPEVREKSTATASFRNSVKFYEILNPLIPLVTEISFSRSFKLWITNDERLRGFIQFDKISKHYISVKLLMVSELSHLSKLKRPQLHFSCDVIWTQLFFEKVQNGSPKMVKTKKICCHL